MSDTTKIQWCDSTVNPIMGCNGCELFLSPSVVLKDIAKAIRKTESPCKTTKEEISVVVQTLLDEVFEHSQNSHPGHLHKVTTSNIWHLRDRLLECINKKHGKKAASFAKTAICKSVTCYAAKQHLNKSSNILDREGSRVPPRKTNPGYSPVFEKLSSYGGRAAKAAKLPDLLGCYHQDTPWKDRLPRMIFVSDMGDAYSNSLNFPFLKADVMPAIQSEEGKRHLWLWLTKRPARMAKFAEEIGGFPPNICAMTTLTGPDRASLQRLEDLKKVKASTKGLSIEPLWKRIPPKQLDLDGIDWVILGGESGALDLARLFSITWVEEIRQHCKDHGVAFFLKQLGRNPIRGIYPVRGRKKLRLRDTHGGDWNEWDEPLRVRQFPQSFHDYRKDEMVMSSTPRTVVKSSSVTF
jgi:protein gp37